MPIEWGVNPAVSPSVYLLRGTHAARPAASAGNINYYYLETDTAGGTLFQSTGSAWVQVAGPVTAAAATFAGLTDVAISTIEDGQLLAYNQAAGKTEPLPGVFGTGIAAIGVPGGIAIGTSDANGQGFVVGPDGGTAIGTGIVANPHGYVRNLITGFTKFLANDQLIADGQDMVEINQFVPLAADCDTINLSVYRVGDLNGHAYTSPTVVISDGVATTQPTLRVQTLSSQLDVSAAGLALSGTHGGIGVFGTTPPTARPAITGALSTVADAAAKAVLTSIIAALVSYGLATDGTT